MLVVDWDLALSTVLVGKILHTKSVQELYVQLCVSGHDGLFLTRGVRIHTNPSQHCTETRMCMHVLALTSISTGVSDCRSVDDMRIRLFWIKAISIFVCLFVDWMLIFVVVGTHTGILQRLRETRALCKDYLLSVVLFKFSPPPVEAQRGFLCVCAHLIP